MKAKITLVAQINEGTEAESKMVFRPALLSKGKVSAPATALAGSRTTFYLRYSEDGKRMLVSVGADPAVAYVAYENAVTRHAANLRPIYAATPLLQDFRNGAADAAPAGSVTWLELRKAFEEKQQQKLFEDSITESSQRRYIRTLKTLDKFFAGRIQSISEVDQAMMDLFKRERIKEIMESHGTKGRSFQLDMKIAKMVFDLAVERKWIEKSPVPKVKELKRRKEDEEDNGADPYSREELQAMLPCLNGDTLLFWLLYQTGLRRSDAIALRWREVDFEAGFIRTIALKNGRKIYIPIMPELLAELKKEFSQRKPASHDLILVNPTNGAPVRGNRLYDRVTALGERAGVKGAKPHRFRDSFAATAFLNGCSTEEVAEYLGDSVAVVSRHYSEFVSERREQADRKLMSGAGLLASA